MFVIAGLGNPGPKFEKNRHNVGFMAADEIVRRHSFGPWKSKFNAEVSEGKLGDEKVLVLKPQTMMNLSGEAVGKALRFYKVPVDHLIVLYDELDLAPGKLRTKVGGGSGGHNGIRSIDSHCTSNYKRVRIGIGHPGHKDRVHSHVLGDFAKADAEWLDPTLKAIADYADLLVAGNDAEFLNRVTLATGSSNSGRPTKTVGAGRAGEKPKQSGKKNSKGQSHIRQARQSAAKTEPPAKGPLADMLKKLFGGDNN